MTWVSKLTTTALKAPPPWQCHRHRWQHRPGANQEWMLGLEDGSCWIYSISSWNFIERHESFKTFESSNFQWLCFSMKSQQTYGVSAFMNQPKIKTNQFINSKSFCLICLSSTLIHPSYPRDFVGGSPSLCKGNHRRRHNWTHHDRGSPTHLWPESVECIMVVMMVMVVQDELRG